MGKTLRVKKRETKGRWRGSISGKKKKRVLAKSRGEEAWRNIGEHILSTVYNKFSA